MSWSRAEIAALAGKAARGVGAPPAQAALFGAAAALHLAQGRDPDLLTEALSAVPGGAIIALPLVLQQVLLASRTDAEVEIAWDGDVDLLRSYLDTLHFACQLETDRPEKVTARFVPKTAAEQTPCRICGCEALLAQMTGLAARTLVPDSAASRSGGAGARTGDDD